MRGMREIVQCMVQREYINANDAYLRMAIGNAAWPIGVTNVGIHSRTGREKIFSQNIAHVLNDETQRKYIQVRVCAVGRCSLSGLGRRGRGWVEKKRARVGIWRFA